MVRNKRELLAAASEWVNHAKDDIRHSLTQFMDRVGADENRMADILGTSVAEIHSILNGTGDVTLSTFAKLLIATDNAIEIKPVAAVMGDMPRGGFPSPEQMQEEVARRGGSTCVGEMPMPPMPPMGGRHPMPPMPQGMPGGCDMMEVDLDRLNTSELQKLALRDGFTRHEIEGKSRGELIDMLETRQQEAIRRGEFGPTPAPWEDEPSFDENDDELEFEDEWNDEEEEASDDWGDEWEEEETTDAPDPCCERPVNDAPKRAADESLARVMMEELDNNPRLREIVRRHLRK